MSIPPFPQCADSPKRRMISDEDCRAYGQACREAALEDAAMAAEDGFKYDLNGYQIADKIRSLK